VVARAGAAGGVDGLERADETRNVFDRVGHRLGRRLAFEPLVDGPPERIPMGRLGARERDGDLERQLGREARKPLELLLQRQRVPGAARKADDHVLSEAVERVVRSPRLDPRERQVGPLGKRRDEARNEAGVDRLLVRVHAPPVRQAASTRARA
jgi:hypothetical protein